MRRKAMRRRIARFGFVAFNIALLGLVSGFVLGNRSSAGSTTKNSVAVSASSTEQSSNPLDQVSAVDIAQTVAVTAGLSETSLVNGQVVAQQNSINYAAASTANTSVVSKPQIVQTSFKSNKDIHAYTIKQGDTMAKIAAQFHVTSNSIKWSNNMATDTVVPGTTLQIPPVDGIVYTVKSGDTAQSLAQTYNASRDLIIAYNDAEISGLYAGERIIIPGGKKPAPTPYYGYGYGAGYGLANVSGNYTLYDRNNCTWWTALRWAQTGRPIMPLLGNAAQWYYTAKSDGLAVSSGVYGRNVPKAHAAAVTSTSGYGHVVFVESVNADGSINISEMNLDGWQTSRVWYSTVPAATAANYLYVY